MGTLSTSAQNTGIAAGRDAAIAAVAATLNNGILRIYSGTPPANANAALGSNTVLAQLTLGSTAFGAPSGGVVTANAISSDTSADATGTPTFFRLFTSADAVQYQGTAGASGQELNLSGLSGGQIVAGGSVSVTSLTITQTASY